MTIIIMRIPMMIRLLLMFSPDYSAEDVVVDSDQHPMMTMVMAALYSSHGHRAAC